MSREDPEVAKAGLEDEIRAEFERMADDCGLDTSRRTGEWKYTSQKTRYTWDGYLSGYLAAANKRASRF